MNLIFRTKKDFMTCSKSVTNKLGLCLTKSDNVYFANIAPASFCFAHVEHNLIKVKLFYN